MTALPLGRATPAPLAAPPVAEPVALLQLSGDTADAASAVYREVRRGRRVVSVVAGGDTAVRRLAEALDAIGVPTVTPAAGEALLHDGVTLAPGPDVAPTRPVEDRVAPLRVALAGCGVVGGGLLPRLLADRRFEVVGVLVRDPGKARDTALPPHLRLTDPAALLAREPDVLVEVLSDASTGLALTRAALSRGIDVVSANKQAIGGDLAALTALADSGGARLLYSASVGGGAPLIETVRRARCHGEIVRIEAVLNGTCNFILNRLADGMAFDTAVAAAQAAGFAEADPSADLDGLDAAAKLAILAHEAADWRLPVDAVARAVLSGTGGLPSGRARQVARLDFETRRAEVAFEAVDGDPLFSDLADEGNALRVTTADGRLFTVRGRGAGRVPTAESVWADLGDLGDVAC
ncbi:MAG: hypothetical protein HYU62_12615 [Caulobacterales bacterium]|nr:hypothetical protein [Caulobacterales bacterium]